MTCGLNRSASIPAAKAVLAESTSKPASSSSTVSITSAMSRSPSTISTRVAPVRRFPSGDVVGLHEPHEGVERDAAVLAAGDAVALELAGIEPLADGARGHVADLGDLAGGQDVFGFEFLHGNACLFSRCAVGAHRPPHTVLTHLPIFPKLPGGKTRKRTRIRQTGWVGCWVRGKSPASIRPRKRCGRRDGTTRYGPNIPHARTPGRRVSTIPASHTPVISPFDLSCPASRPPRLPPMHVLFVHPNFPAQFGHIGSHLARAPGLALHVRQRDARRPGRVPRRRARRKAPVPDARRGDQDQPPRHAHVREQRLALRRGPAGRPGAARRSAGFDRRSQRLRQHAVSPRGVPRRGVRKPVRVLLQAARPAERHDLPPRLGLAGVARQVLKVTLP